MLIAGDVGIRRPDPASIFVHVADVLRGGDLTLVNQEWPLTNHTEAWPGKTGKVIGSPPEAVEALLSAGVDVVSLANNHMLNYGEPGLRETLAVLDGAGIRHAGAGLDFASAHAPAILERKGARIAVLSYTSVFPRGWEAGPQRFGLATVRVDSEYTPYYRADEMPGVPYDVVTTPDPDDAAQVEQDIRAARDQAEVVVVMWHWGVSMGYQHLVPYQVEMAHRAIDAGADIVVGHHPHTLQPIEIYNGKPICYSVAQFGFDLDTLAFADETVLLEVEVTDGRLGELRLHPALSLPDGSVDFLHGDQAVPVIAWLQRLCRTFNTRLIPDGDCLRVQLESAPGAS